MPALSRSAFPHTAPGADPFSSATVFPIPLPPDVAIIMKHGSPYFQTDESVLGSLLCFDPEAPKVADVYKANGSRVTIESRKRAIPHANGSGFWWHTHSVTIDPTGAERVFQKLQYAKEDAESWEGGQR